MFSRIKRTIREFRELKYLAYHDPLTGLLNRNWLYKNAEKITAKYVYFIDINNLHKVNERGHTFGDEHIKNIVNSISVLREDRFIRYAGDEFIIFSNRPSAIETNALYAVGCVLIGDDIEASISEADTEMLRNKKTYKTK